MFKNRRVRTFAIAMVLSGMASIIGLALYLTPLQDLTYLNRVADYVFINDAATFLTGATDKQSVNYLEKVGLKTRNLQDINDDLKIITIDEVSLLPPPQGLGQFPFPRAVYSRLLHNLKKAGAKVVAFDVNFLEPSHDNGDKIFAEGMRAMPPILPFNVSTTTLGILGKVPIDPNLDPYTSAQGYTTVDNPGGILMGQPLTIDVPEYHGQTPDGKALVIPKQHYLSLVSAAIHLYTHKNISTTNPRWAKFGTEPVPLDGSGRFLMVPFTEIVRQDISQRVGSEKSSIPFAEKMTFADAYYNRGNILKDFAKGKLVVIGPTAQGLGDFIETPTGRFAGVYANLRMMDQLMAGLYIHPVPKWLDILLIITLPFLLGFFVTQFNATRGILFCLLGIVLYSLIAVALYATRLTWLDMTHVAGAMLLATLFVAIYRTITEGADKKMIKNMFGAHVSPEVVAEMLKGDDPKHALALQGKRVKATIFYSDIRGFTSMSENMTPEEIYGQLNEYFEEMCAIIFKYGGYVDKFIGDCVMAVFSAPNQKPDDAKRAVLAAIEQQAKIVEMGAAWAKEGRQIFTVGMGCNTGEVVMGNLGSSTRLNYTVIGDSVNTAARLYNVAKGGETIISESTWEEVKDFVEVEELEPVTVKGKVKPLRIFNVIGMKKEPGVAAVSADVLGAESSKA